MATPQEPDFPPGHPARHDYDPNSPEAKEWARKFMHPKGERDFPVDHPKAVDTPGNTNHIAILPGVDPQHPEREALTGRSPEQAKAYREFLAQSTATARETPPAEPTMALEPPKAKNVARVRPGTAKHSWEIFCPACQEVHTFDHRFKFNGSLELPTFTPSLMVHKKDADRRCHSIVTNGRIAFQEDSAHKLSGKTVDLPPISAAEGSHDA